MKNLLSLLVATLMVISVLPYAAFAAVDTDVQAVYDALTSEMLTTDNEPDYAVTKNLDLDLSDDLTLPEGVTVSFASSLTTAIADDGSVTRDANLKKDVTLTATITKDGSDTLTKEFNFTVLPITSEVIASDNLYYPEHVNKALVSYETGSAMQTVSDWTLSAYSADITANHFDAKFLKDSSGYYNATGTRLTGQTATYIRYAPSSVPDIIQTADDKYVTLTMNFNPVQFTQTTTKQFYLHVYGKKSGSDALISYVQFWNDRTRICENTANNTELFKSSTHVNEGANNEVQLKIDYNSGLMYLTLNGTLLNPEGTAITNADASTQISYINFGCFRQMTDSVMQINDIAITKKTSYKVKSVNDITAEILADGQVPDFITENLKFPANTDITYTSSNPEVITDKGVVTRPTLNDEIVTLTATNGTDTKAVQFTVKSYTTSAVAFNESFIASYSDSSLLGTAYGLFTDPELADAVYANSDDDYYLDYTSTPNVKTSYNPSKVSYETTTGSSFPVGSTGEYVIEYEASFNNEQHTAVTITGDNSADAIRVNNGHGKIYISNHATNYWYNTDVKVYGNVTEGYSHKFKIVIDTVNSDASIYMDGEPLVTDMELVDGVTFGSSIGFYIRTKWETGDTAPTINAKFDNFRIYTTSGNDDAIKNMPNSDKAEYFAKLITQNSITTDNYYNLTNNLDLNNTALKNFDLADMGVSVAWTSSNPSVISNSGVVTRTDKNEYVTMTATVTAGEGSNAVTVTKSFGYTVPADDSKIFSTYNYTFDNDTLGAAPADWTAVSNATVTTVAHPERSGNVLQADFTSTACYARRELSKQGSLNKRYQVSADVFFEPDSTSTKMYFELMAAAAVTRIGFNFQTGGISMSGDNTDRTYMVPGVVAKPGEWYHIDIDFNAAQKNVMAYINGVPLTAEPLDIYDNIWAGYLYVRQVGLYSYGTGKGYLDNVIIRESNSNAPVYDENSDYTVRSIALTNQDGKTITNATAETTSVIANVKVIKNREIQNGEAKILFARYSADRKLEQLVISDPINTAAPGYETNGQILKVEMPLESGNSTDFFKIFVIDSNKITPVSKNYNSIAPKFDTEKLFNMDMNVTLASELGYDAESDYEGIDAIIYDGDTYLGKKAKHFAYIGLPEDASADNPVPAVVCVHGGGGTAYDEWVKKWNDNGYAAIAMNLNGRIPQDSISDGNAQLRHAWAGATQDSYGTVSPDDATWMYSAVTAVIGAHNVLRALPEVDNSKIGITGVSWGGVVTSTTIGVDDRFSFAIPAYGCGFLYGSETYMANAMTEEKKLWDPSSFIGKADIPILWMNGDKDGNFSLTSTTKSALLAGDNSYPCIIPNFAHSHSPVWNRPEGYAFADSVVNGGTEFIRGNVTISGTTATVKTNRAAASATMYYTISDTLTYLNGTSAQFSYSVVSNSATNTDTFTFQLPSDAKKFYIVFTDENNNNSSTVLYDVE